MPLVPSIWNEVSGNRCRNSPSSRAPRRCGGGASVAAAPAGLLRVGTVCRNFPSSRARPEYFPEYFPGIFSRNIFPEYFLTNDKRGNIRPYVTLAASKSRARRWPDRRTFRMADRTANARECSQSLTFSIAGRCAGPAVQRRSVYAAPGLHPDARKLFAADR